MKKLGNSTITIENVTRTINYWGTIVTKDYGKKVYVTTDKFDIYVHFNNDGSIIETSVIENALEDVGLSYHELFEYTK